MSSLKRVLEKKINALVLERVLAKMKQDLAQTLVCESGPMTTKLRDEALILVDVATETSDVHLDKGHLLRLSRLPLTSMTQGEALESILGLIKQHLVAKANFDKEIGILKQRRLIDVWTSGLERLIYKFREGQTDFDSRYLALLCSPAWREELGFGTTLRGQPFQLRDVDTAPKEREYEPVHKMGGLQSATMLWLHMEDGSITSLDKQITVRGTLPDLSLSVIVPSHPILLELKSDHILVWAWGGAEPFAQQTLAHGLTAPDYVDATVCPSGHILIQVGVRNYATGGHSEFESVIVRYDTKSGLLKPDQMTEEDMQAQDALDANRALAQSIDFRDHSSLLSLHTKPDGQSTAYFNTTLCAQTSEVCVGALGSPQEFYMVMASGIVHTYVRGLLQSQTDMGAGIRACVI